MLNKSPADDVTTRNSAPAQVEHTPDGDFTQSWLFDTFHTALQRNLIHYVQTVAITLRVPPEAYWCDATNAPAHAYLALADRVTQFGDRDLSLLWDEENGWALAVESVCDEGLVVLAYQGTDLLPPPERVQVFLSAALIDVHTGRANPPHFRNWADTDLEARLISILLPARAKTDGQIPSRWT